MCLIEKIRVSDKRHSGMGYSAVDYEFNGSEATMYIK